MYNNLNEQEIRNVIGDSDIQMASHEGRISDLSFKSYNPNSGKLVLEDQNAQTMVIPDVFRVDMHGNIATVRVLTRDKIFDLTGIGNVTPKRNRTPVIALPANENPARGLEKPLSLAEQQSLLYLDKGYLSFDQKMENGFFDGGREMKQILTPNGKAYTSDREIIVFDANQDLALNNALHQAEILLNRYSDQANKIIALAQFVNQLMGGKVKHVVDLSEKNIDQVSVNSGGQKILHIGKLTYGSCRHRSLLFKYLADRLGIESRVIRGGFRGGAHAWNIVRINDQYYLVDIMIYPGKLFPAESVNFGIYQREGKHKHFRGGAGAKSIID